MKYLYSFFIALLLFTSCISVKADVYNTSEKTTSNELAEAGIRLVLQQQESAWNNQDLEGFMDGYWKSDELKFYGASGLTKGWDQTLANYKKRYPTKRETGTLNFVINDISRIEGNNYWVMGEYHLKREIGDANGIFIIIFKQINGEWKIIADMTC
ncbi:nuclear transport factor 2 family protein [Winogradskyella vincentii]|uniref:Nuclear transport factor 2 family protein n=1 Tax=Winogradskyella vincentii TaxID=2877122 RepID=A0ABS7XWL8_9FLAO|nr:nuclear transport factor 2 family protein [Winogradskyella vincentii]MCA0152049.1 nuclear transport factor 2 family protein [Winogradskyella vincentii]